jgi:DinB superfamily
MIKLYFIFLLFIAPYLGFAQGSRKIWTLAERQYLLTGLKTTQSEFNKEVSQLNERQIHFKIDSTQWSIGEVIEHLGVYEELLYWDLMNNQYTPERPDLVDSVKGVDSAMTAYAGDPNKGQAPLVAQPLGRFNNKKDLISFFDRNRNEVIKLVEETNTDFRLHFIYRPADWGIWHIRDLHQYTLLWIAHTERHLNQIRRVKAHARFPK